MFIILICYSSDQTCITSTTKTYLNDEFREQLFHHHRFTAMRGGGDGRRGWVWLKSQTIAG